MIQVKVRSAAWFALSTEIEALFMQIHCYTVDLFIMKSSKTCLSFSSGEEPSKITNHKLFPQMGM